MQKIRLVIAAALALSAGAAQAQHRGGQWTPHQGLNLHLDLGVAYLSTESDEELTNGTYVDTVRDHGAGLDFALSAGGAIAPNLILSGEYWYMSASDPEEEFAGDTYSLDGTTISLMGIGPKLTYYFAPQTANVYVAVTPSLTWLRYKWEGESETSKAGFGARFAIGKEWLVSRGGLGLGVAGHLAFASNEFDDFDVRFNTVTMGVAFSATYH